MWLLFCAVSAHVALPSRGWKTGRDAAAPDSPCPNRSSPSPSRANRTAHRIPVPQGFSCRRSCPSSRISPIDPPAWAGAVSSIPGTLGPRPVLPTPCPLLRATARSPASSYARRRCAAPLRATRCVCQPVVVGAERPPAPLTRRSAPRTAHRACRPREPARVPR